MKRIFHIAPVLLLGMGVNGLSLAEESAAADWPLCPTALDIPARPTFTDKLESDDILILADDAELVDEGISNLRGDVEITQNQQQIRSDRVRYNQSTNQAQLNGSVKYWDNAVFLDSDRAELELNDNTGVFEQSKYRIVDNRGRGQADKLEIDAGKTTKLYDVDYSTCEAQSNFWKLSASRIKLDHEEEIGTARNVVLKVKDVPVFYTPYLSFPLADRRKSGLLAPSFGSSNQNGTEIATPYYWNIAPNMDATITPRFFSDSGLMMMGEYRYLFSRGSGEVNLEYLPSDANFNDRDRNLFGLRHQQTFLDTGNLNLDYNRVSDREYFEDFGNNLNVASTRFLLQQALATYSGSWWNGSFLLQNFQTVDRSLPASSRPFRRLPQLSFNAFSPYRNRALNYRLESQMVYFDRNDDGGLLTDNSAYRVDLYPTVSYPMRNLAGYVEPKVGMRFTQYSIDNPSNQDSNPNRLTPVVSVDSGLFFEREVNLFSNRFTQTLEPQLYYLYIPEDEQEDLPIFDTGLYDFSYYSLFRENRFSSVDRIGDTNQFTLALTSRFIDRDTGQERGFLRVGQIYYIDDRDALLPGTIDRNESSSPIVSEMSLNLTLDWKIRTEYQWDPDINRTQKLVTQLQYNPEPGKVVNFAYRVRNDQQNRLSAPLSEFEQSDVSFRWPFNRQWSAVGRWNYAVPERRSIETFLGLEYEDCCWGIRLVGRRYLTDITGDYQNGIFLQLELKGLSGVGRRTSDFLRQNIRGYEQDF